ncbi:MULTISPECIES: zinc ribbon domain-containing protein [Paracoccus]|uniref:zinc ribbon domain-containing protein n=1 Tax=Paracoccus TaxID=265 RepID=UPI000FD78634|nr:MULTISPECIES: zinc ribbon domain-containing protein [Paracoccus]AZY94768.1 zinc ribbon domain-containing protein [Paracoccus sp. Arc7-R13]TNC02411.1 zinc ribbon domain-containing protein [Paracoccus marcusii]
MIPAEHRFPCGQCGASLTFRPGQQELVCDWCGHRQTIGPGPARAPGRKADDSSADPALQWSEGPRATGPALREIPLAEGLDLSQGAADIVQTVRTLSCPNCGAQVDLDADHHASACPFCATPVVTDTGPTRRIKPQGVMPFTLTEAQARAAMKAWLGSLWFAPSGLTAYARKDRRLSGIYSPFWTFDADTTSRYRGQRGDAYYVMVQSTQTVNGRTQTVSRQERRIRWTPVSGQVARQFNDVLIPASTALPPRFSEAMKPWDLSAVAEYDPRFLSGFEAEGYTVPLADGHGAARQQMAQVIHQDACRSIGGAEQRVDHVDSRFVNETFKHVLLPIWAAAYRYNGASYRFVVNGQTGKVMGERPYSAWKIAGAVAVALVALAAILYLTQ